MDQITTAKRFVLQRNKDISGLSGTGVVAEGVQFSDGRVAVRWRPSKHGSGNTASWDSVEELIAIHGHEGATVIRWVDA